MELETLLTRAESLGVTLALETSPYGFLGTGAAVSEVVDQVGHSNLSVCFDCANVLPSRTPPKASGRLEVASGSLT